MLTMAARFPLANGPGSCFSLSPLVNDCVKERGGMAELKSEFAKKLAANAELSAWCEQVADSIRAAAGEDTRATESSEQLTREDFAVYINARTDNSLYPTE